MNYKDFEGHTLNWEAGGAMVWEKGNDLIGNFQVEKRKPSEMQANAILAAAAPDLLEACKRKDKLIQSFERGMKIYSEDCKRKDKEIKELRKILNELGWGESREARLAIKLLAKLDREGI